MSSDTNGTLYAIHDRIAQAIIGGVQLHRHEAAAIRTFGDIASMQDSVVRLHPADFELVRLGHLDRNNELIPDHAVIMTGAQWAAAQQPPANEGV